MWYYRTHTTAVNEIVNIMHTAYNMQQEAGTNAMYDII